ncbi:hypothetical protein [Pseudofrankia sp. DC12]|uniref:hypothetical protein n=1 Tax=Pseudofrankia sp. DC12 TaxID=683315 RepID=UPI0005F86995|nr:hypothetical protein [Pseudofrankia sp. DC12]
MPKAVESSLRAGKFDVVASDPRITAFRARLRETWPGVIVSIEPEGDSDGLAAPIPLDRYIILNLKLGRRRKILWEIKEAAVGSGLASWDPQIPELYS